MLPQSIGKKINRLKNHTDFRKILGNTGWLFADRILRMGIGLFVGVWVARYLGVEQFGIFNYATAFVALFGTISTLGLPSLVIRTITENPEQREQILGTTFWLQLSAGIVTLLLTVSAILIFKPNDPLMINLVAILASISIFRSFDTIDLWFQSQVKSKYTVLAKNTAFVIVAVVKVILINLHAPLLAFAWATLAEFVISAVGLILSYKLQGYSLRLWRWSFSLAKKLLKESWHSIIAGISVIMYSKIDQIMLGTMLTNSKELGIYSAAVRIAEVFDFIPLIVSSSLLPKLIQWKSLNPKDYLARFQVYVDIMLLFWIICAIPVSLFSEEIVDFLYGSEFQASSKILSIYIFAQFGANLGIARSSFFNIERKLYYSLPICLCGLVVNVLLNLFLIPYYGAMGATAATLITQLFVAVLINFFVKDLRVIGFMIIRSFLVYNIPKRIKKIIEQISK